MEVHSGSRHWEYFLLLCVIVTTSLVTGMGDKPCNDQCKHGAVCNETGCVCDNGYNLISTFSRPGSAVFYCLEICNPNSTNCTENKVCLENEYIYGTYYCYCKDGSKPEPSGKCSKGITRPTSTLTTAVTTARLSTQSTVITGGDTSMPHTSVHTSKGKTTTTSAIVPGSKPTSASTKDKGAMPKKLTIGLATGIGGFVLLAIIAVIIAVVVKRKRKSPKGSGVSSLQKMPGCESASVFDMSGQMQTNAINPAYNIGDLSSEVFRLNRGSGMTGQYEEVDMPAQTGATVDVSGLYSTANKTPKVETTETELNNGLYSNNNIAETKARQNRSQYTRDEIQSNVGDGKGFVQSISSNQNQESIPSGVTGSANSISEAHEYDTTYSLTVEDREQVDVVSRNKQQQGDYDVLKLQKINDGHKQVVVEAPNLGDLYSNSKIPENKARQQYDYL